jgi:pimeloyl-ACP methyl ester carboxylesterase
MAQPVVERAVTVVHDGVVLAGALWLPDPPVRATVLMHPGSGPSDRDNDVYFPPIRRHLLEHGFAVCAFDKRGVGGSSGCWQDAGIVEQAADVGAAVAMLAGEADLDAPVGLFGHSQGGWVVLEAAGRAATVAFVVSNSGPGVSPADQERYAATRRMQRAGMTPAEIDEMLEHYELMLRLLRARRPFAEARARITEIEMQCARDLSQLMFVPADAEEWALATSIIDYDPRPALRALRVPVLALFGADDAVVPVEPSVAAYRDEVATDLLTIVVLPGGDHRIQTDDPPGLVTGYLETLTTFIADAV